MFNEQPNTGMEIKQTPTDKEVMFENPYIEEDMEMSQPQMVMEPGMPEAVILYRSKEGIQRWLPEQRVGELLAQTKNMTYDKAFAEKYKGEIKNLFEKQPEGKEVKNVFEILEPGDSINHQTVVSVSNNSVELDYFGKKSTLVNEMEIFSILIKEEIEEWKRQIREIDTRNLFSKDDDDFVTVFRALELLCMQVNMEECEGLYAASIDRLTLMLTAVMAMSLKKPIYGDDAGKKVVTISADYSDKDCIKPNNNEILYHISLTNKDNIEVRDGDVVIC